MNTTTNTNIIVRFVRIENQTVNATSHMFLMLDSVEQMLKAKGETFDRVELAKQTLALAEAEYDAECEAKGKPKAKPDTYRKAKSRALKFIGAGLELAYDVTNKDGSEVRKAYTFNELQNMLPKAGEAEAEAEAEKNPADVLAGLLNTAKQYADKHGLNWADALKAVA